MTINYGPVCTCGQMYWSTAPVPCPVHGYFRQVTNPTTTWTSVTRVCQGRHCAHDAQCNRTYTING